MSAIERLQEYRANKDKYLPLIDHPIVITKCSSKCIGHRLHENSMFSRKIGILGLKTYFRFGIMVTKLK